MNQLLLDTHVWIWFANGNTEIPSKIKKLINQAGHQNGLFASAISAWELSMLEVRKKIILGMPCLDWIKQSLNSLNMQLLPLSPEVSVESCHLPAEFHSDPADQIIIATARVHNLHLVSKDKKIIQYSKKNI